MLRHLTLAVFVAAGITACGGSDPASDASSSAPPANTPPTSQATDEPNDSSATAPAPQPDVVPGGGVATLTLDNGESFEFSILCSLEPQMAAGSEILFSVTSYDDPGVDATQFGDEGPVTGVASIQVYDGDYNTLWDASSFAEALGGGVELSLDGSTVTGSGKFYPGGDISLEPVDGQFTANC